MQVEYVVKFPLVEVKLNGKTIGNIAKESGMNYYWLTWSTAKLPPIMFDEDWEKSKALCTSYLENYYKVFHEIVKN